ncbi:MAG: hypothetical protein C4521_13660 [Actinobacteria bacterium]|nr:MAG: hypothetical protein C4521_13660 [Actinomycetota bacterium]
MEQVDATDPLITLREASEKSECAQWRLLAAGLAGKMRLVRSQGEWSLGRASFEVWLERRRQGPKPPSIISY